MKSLSLSVDCQWAGWNQYTACSKTCGSGTQSRSRTKTVTEQYDGTCIGLSSKTRSCNTQNCPSNSFLFIYYRVGPICLIFSKMSVGRME